MTQGNNRKIKMGMVGGGKDAFIGAVHRIAAQIDGQIELVCGAFSSDAARSIESGQALFLPATRCYDNYQQMLAHESALPATERMDFVAIVTPNHMHFPVAKAALEHGFHVLSDKPATLNLNEALALKEIVEKTGQLYGLTHTYNGYPMVKQAREMIAEGKIGKVVKVVIEYSQGWLADKDSEAGKQASWRLDPAKSGSSCCMGDIGVHAANLAEYITGQNIDSICAELSSVVEGRTLDDDGTVLLRFDQGAHGVLLASQISIGEENNLNIRIYGDKASVSWVQQEPNSLWLKFNDQPSQLIRSGVGNFSNTVAATMRTPAGHPEGYLEAFANIYQGFASQIRNLDSSSNTKSDVPGIDEAVRGMAFIENVVQASQSDLKWHKIAIN
ncbi:Gfo/Idh/MocA family protein [Shewanella sp. 10N.286.48.B5]|uniref:Gfo/Idh/MocA family protein n=1 Tax=Shewanella sp. 10N.286.48.B5 TaxID=1880834 RepID=UPI000CB3400F|nr:Gfo/Idh/MocA family oxidoreductase [Shewanella sp. 10N.286.48.B5]PMH85523.1 oxidoreductase [Shewanella sp. 10N.286.48.B5]